jgi:hypothetical protein
VLAGVQAKGVPPAEGGNVTLQRLVLDYRTGELVVRCLYRSKGDANPGTVRRRREVEDLVRTGLQDALTALQDGRVDVVGVSGYQVREDILSIASPSKMASPTRVKGA